MRLAAGGPFVVQILLTHAHQDSRRAKLLAERLEQQGLKVQRTAVSAGLPPLQRRRLDKHMSSAARVVFLWSRSAQSPAMRAAAARAKTSGKLAIARLDKTTPPATQSMVNLSGWTGRPVGGEWRKLVETVGASTAPPRDQAARVWTKQSAPLKKSGGAWLWVLGLLAVAGAGAGAYFTLLR
jgi:hypothetical protein